MSIAQWLIYKQVSHVAGKVEGVEARGELDQRGKRRQAAMLPYNVFPLQERLRQMQRDHEHKQASCPLLIGLGPGHFFVSVAVLACLVIVWMREG